MGFLDFIHPSFLSFHVPMISHAGILKKKKKKISAVLFKMPHGLSFTFTRRIWPRWRLGLARLQTSA